MELKVTFLCVVYVGELAITGGEDGIVILHFFRHSYLIKLYLWGDDQILKKEENAHRKGNINVPILCLASVKDSNIFVSGGMGGRVIVWKQNQEEIKFIVDYPLGKGKSPQEVM